MVWYSHLFQNFPQFIVIHTVKGFGIVNKAEIDVFLELSCFFDDPADVGNLISGSSAFSKTSLNIREFMVHVLLKPGLENFPFISFSALIAVAETSKTMKNSSGEGEHPCLVPDFRGNAFNFSPLRIMFSVSLSYMAFIMLRYVPSIPAF